MVASVRLRGSYHRHRGGVNACEQIVKNL